MMTKFEIVTLVMAFVAVIFSIVVKPDKKHKH